MKKLLLLAILAGGVLPACATLVDFEGQGDIAPISNGYGGLNWTAASYTLNGTSYFGNPSGYQACKVSGDMVGFSASAGTFGWATPDGRNFQSLTWYIGAAWRDDLVVKIKFYEGGFGGTLLFTQTMSPAPLADAPTQWILNIPGYMDAITFDAEFNSGTVHQGYTGDGEHLVFDDIEYTLVPEPATVAALGLGAVLLLRRRR